jgi:hypothetical protein
MGIEFWALTFDFAGKVIIGIMAILVHMKIRKAHKIDTEVLNEIYVEEIMGILGILLIVAGYFLKLQIM